TIATGVPVVRLAYATQRSSTVVASAITTRVPRARSAWLGSGELQWLHLDTQVANCVLQEPDAAACGLVAGGVARLRAAETQGVGQRVGIVAGRSQQCERLVGQVEMLAGATQLEAALPHALRDLQWRPTGRMRRARAGTVPPGIDNLAGGVGPPDVTPVGRGRTAPFGAWWRPNRMARQGGHTHQSGLAGA